MTTISRYGRQSARSVNDLSECTLNAVHEKHYGTHFYLFSSPLCVFFKAKAHEELVTFTPGEGLKRLLSFYGSVRNSLWVFRPSWFPSKFF